MPTKINQVFHAALELQAVLAETGRPFCFIGGLALQRWGENRFTQDADATVLTNFEFDEQVVRHLLSRFKSRRPDGASFALQNRVVLLEASNGIFLDVALGALEFEAHAVGRAIDWILADGQSLRICTAEDLVVHRG